MNNQKVTYDWCLKTFLKTLEQVQNGATPVYQCVSKDISKAINQRKVLSDIPHNSAIWQHTPAYHVAMIYIEAGTSQKFGRKWLDLIASGVDTEKKLKTAWIKSNGSEDIGYIPSVKKSITSQARKKNESYIVADLKRGENNNSKIQGNLHNVHRTHLISAQITGIEAHKGLLIDYDGWLNSKPLNDFEQDVIRLAQFQDIVWVAKIFKSTKGLVFQYYIYNKNWLLIDTLKVIDDRWTYLWYYDK